MTTAPTTSMTQGAHLPPSASVVLTTAAGAKRLGGNASGLSPWSSHPLEAPGRPTIEDTATPCRHGRLLTGFALRWEGQEYGVLLDFRQRTAAGSATPATSTAPATGPPHSAAHRTPSGTSSTPNPTPTRTRTRTRTRTNPTGPTDSPANPRLRPRRHRHRQVRRTRARMSQRATTMYHRPSDLKGRDLHDQFVGRQRRRRRCHVSRSLAPKDSAPRPIVVPRPSWSLNLAPDRSTQRGPHLIHRPLCCLPQTGHRRPGAEDATARGRQ